MTGRGERPVGDRTEPEEERAAAREEPARGLAAPAVAHRLQRVEQEKLPWRARTAAGDRVEQRPRLRQRAALPGVDDLEPRVRPLELGRLAHERDECRGLVERRFRRHREEERLDVSRIVGGEDDVVAPEEPVQGTVELVDACGCGERDACREHRCSHSEALLTEIP